METESPANIDNALKDVENENENEPIDQKDAVKTPIFRIGSSIQQAAKSLQLRSAVEKSEVVKSPAVVSQDVEIPTKTTSVASQDVETPTTSELEMPTSNIDPSTNECESIFTDLKCEDCRKSKTQWKWRWCRKCDRILCERCTVDGHLKEDEDGKNIEDYTTAVRGSNSEFRTVLELVREAIKTLEKGAEELQQYGNGVVAKMERFKRDIASLGKKDEKVLETFKWQLRNLGAFARRPINARWLSTRETYVRDTETVKNEVQSHQVAWEKRLADLDVVVKTLSGKLDKIFAEEE